MNTGTRIDLGNGYVTDREPWERFLRAVEQAFPDPFGDDDGEERKFRERIIAAAKAGGNLYRLGLRLECGPPELMALKRCDAIPVECDIRPAGCSVP